MTKKEKDIQEAYENSKNVKKALRLLPVNSEIDIDFRNVAVEKKPFLVVVCYESDIISTFRDKIVVAVKDCALAVRFLRDVGDLNIRDDKNTVIFDVGYKTHNLL